MKSVMVLSAFASAAVAQNCLAVALTAIPGCAQSCILNGAPSIGCSGTDFACQCDKEAALYAAIEGCVSSACPEPSYQAVIDGASSVCNCATGVVIATTTDAQGATMTATTTSTSAGNTVITYPTQTSGPGVTTGATTGASGATGGVTGTAGGTGVGVSSTSVSGSSRTATGTVVPVVTAGASTHSVGMVGLMAAAIVVAAM
ncbi:hypothetical protein BKA67DRAFT_534512 [Truncatella angustata]|uniref:CFEM domain-containing protein n=1 Tax=Truncatella angustata TaxID=152316 RepID=A0A9P8ZY32_9PEZI|nr:uncharacterized protein BKA67DRAFT_534512 [Truncatella angustata]KAH6655596.1 hypothetical protein BKA67DRAFT_534512 [Truncatella angustata]KAH8197792.1 hypothetical protein TruAng_008039 [Truncatella angustata]